MSRFPSTISLALRRVFSFWFSFFLLLMDFEAYPRVLCERGRQEEPFAGAEASRMEDGGNSARPQARHRWHLHLLLAQAATRRENTSHINKKCPEVPGDPRERSRPHLRSYQSAAPGKRFFFFFWQSPMNLPPNHFCPSLCSFLFFPPLLCFKL